MFQNLPSSNKSEWNKTNPSLLCPFNSPPPPHHQAAWKGPVYSLSLLSNLPLTPQPSTIWLPPYHFTEIALLRVTLFECKRLRRQFRHSPMLLTTAFSGAWLTLLLFLLGHVVHWLHFCFESPQSTVLGFVSQHKGRCQPEYHQSVILLWLLLFSCWVVPNSLWPHGLQPARLLCPWNSPGKNAGVPSPGDLPDPGTEPGSPTWQADSLLLSHLGSPILLRAESCWEQRAVAREISWLNLLGAVS